MWEAQKLPRVVVTAPVNFVSVRAVTVVQKFIIHKTFSWPRTRHECKLRCVVLIVENLVVMLLIVVLVYRVTTRWDLNSYIFYWELGSKKKRKWLVNKKELKTDCAIIKLITKRQNIKLDWLNFIFLLFEIIFFSFLLHFKMLSVCPLVVAHDCESMEI